MSNNKVTVDNLAKAIQSALKEFEGFTDDAVNKGLSETAKNAARKLRNAHPADAGDWSEYNSGWTVKATKRDKRATVHNADHYQLTHLLEHGHAIKKGGREVGHAQAFEHITPVYEEAQTELVENIRKNING